VAAVDVDDEEGSTIVKAVDPNGERARYFHCDITSSDEVRAVFSEAVDWMGGLDVLANVAGVEGGAPAEDMSEHEWDRVFAVNVKGTVFTNQAAFRHLRDRGGSIINFGSGAGIRAEPGAAHYAASKAAVMSWTRTAAVEWARHNIRIVSVAPAAWTRMYDSFRGRMSPKELEMHEASMRMLVPLGGRLGDPDADIAPVMVFLASPDAHFITGQVICVDGGAVMLAG
jgi:NAD(P)-dependent dehydrogenase (short-subunit alcohol dehydrogenase family)